MKKRTAIIITLIMLIMVTLSGCGEVKLSGTYVDEDNKDNYFKFSGENNVSLYSEQGHIDGTYYIIDDAAILYFDSEPEFNTLILEIKNNRKVYLLSTAFVKQGFLKRNWGKILIGILILGVIIRIYEKTTGRNIEDDLDKADEKLDEFNDKLDDKIDKITDKLLD